MPKLTLKEIKRRLLSRHNIEADELEVVFKQDEDQIREFYTRTVLKVRKVDTLKPEVDGEGKVEEDSFKLDPARLKEIDKVDKAKKTAKEKGEKLMAEVQKTVAEETKKVGKAVKKENFKALQKSLPKDAQVSEAEIAEAMKGLSLDDLLNEDDDEDTK